VIAGVAIRTIEAGTIEAGTIEVGTIVVVLRIANSEDFGRVGRWLSKIRLDVRVVIGASIRVELFFGRFEPRLAKVRDESFSIFIGDLCLFEGTKNIGVDVSIVETTFRGLL